jgi:hypothetical protein
LFSTASLPRFWCAMQTAVALQLSGRSRMHTGRAASRPPDPGGR